MPKLTRAQTDRLPATLRRSPPKAQRTFVEALESAADVRGHVGDEAYAHRVAFAAVKHTFEKVGDHWEAKEHPGPSDTRAAAGGPGHSGASHGGVDARATKSHLLALARRLGVPGRSRMTKDELVEAIERANARASAQARRS